MSHVKSEAQQQNRSTKPTAMGKRKQDAAAGAGSAAKKSKNAGEREEVPWTEYMKSPANDALVQKIKGMMVDRPSELEGGQPKKYLTKEAAGLLNTSVVAAMGWSVRSPNGNA